jgi:hypothetical protein
MVYHIYGLCPRTDIDMSRAGFGVKLWPAWRDAVRELNLDQRQVNTAVGRMGRAWLDGCGYGDIYDPDNCGFDRDKQRKPGPNAKPTYEPNLSLRVLWGEWGPEHITVPGNACGLDISSGFGCPMGGKSLEPHNVDTIAQAHLLLVVFTWFADCVVLELQKREFAAR